MKCSKGDLKLMATLVPTKRVMNTMFFWNGFYFYFFYQRGTGPF